MAKTPMDNIRLSVVMDELKTKPTNELYEELYRLVAESVYFISCVGLANANQPVQTLQVPLLRASNGEQYYPVFTDTDELRKWTGMDKTNVKAMYLCIDDYIELLEYDTQDTLGIVINPFSQSFIIRTELLKHLKTVRDKANPEAEPRSTLLSRMGVVENPHAS